MPQTATDLRISNPESQSDRPLVIDVDGTLIRSDLFVETFFARLSRAPASLLEIVVGLLKGKAALKHRLAQVTDFDPALLPYDEDILALARQASQAGRKIYLASASNERLVEAIARHLGIFTGWFASDATTNLSRKVKMRRLVEAFGRRGFDYVGSEAADLPVWAEAATGITVRAPKRVKRALARISIPVEHLVSAGPNWGTWLNLFRVHQYAKNALLFVPLLTAHQFALHPLLNEILAFIAFCLCASSAYVLNDIVDLWADRAHPTKRHRPLANGSIPLAKGILAGCLLFLTAIAVAALVSLPFLGVLLGYFALTVSYSFWLKRKMLVDVVTLAILYTIRVIAGSVAIGVATSEWLLTFSIFIFTSLALIKRYVELAVRLDANLPDPSNRNYKIADLGIVASLAAAAGYNAVIVFTLYISSTTVSALYSRPRLLWLICPLLMYWISRALLMAHRRLMVDDPIVFALRDKISRITIVVIVIVVLAAL